MDCDSYIKQIKNMPLDISNADRITLVDKAVTACEGKPKKLREISKLDYEFIKKQYIFDTFQMYEQNGNLDDLENLEQYDIIMTVLNTNTAYIKKIIKTKSIRSFINYINNKINDKFLKNKTMSFKNKGLRNAIMKINEDFEYMYYTILSKIKKQQEQEVETPELEEFAVILEDLHEVIFKILKLFLIKGYCNENLNFKLDPSPPHEEFEKLLKLDFPDKFKQMYSKYINVIQGFRSCLLKWKKQKV